MATVGDMRQHLAAYLFDLEAADKSRHTIKSYRDAINGFIASCERNGETPALDRNLVRRWMIDLKSTNAIGTVARRVIGIKQFAKWCVREKIIDDNPIENLPTPRIDTPVVDVLTEQQISDLLDTCHDGHQISVRDKAIISLMIDTGMRASEIIAMTIDHLDLDEQVILITRTKSKRDRVVPFGDATAAAIKAYLGQRGDPLSGPLWIGKDGVPLNYAGLHRMVQRRGTRIGLVDLHPHQFRHSFADRWLDAGGSEGGCMVVGGWSDRSMLDRYGAKRREVRALAEAARLFGRRRVA